MGIKRQERTEESEYHIVGIRMRITGDGIFQLGLLSYDDLNPLVMVPLTMQPTTRIEPTRLCNYQSQRTKMFGQTNNMNEFFRISRILVFVKPVAVEYPM